MQVVVAAAVDIAAADDEVAAVVAAAAANGKQREGKCLPLLAVFIFHGMLLIIPIVMPHNTHTTYTHTHSRTHTRTFIGIETKRATRRGRRDVRSGSNTVA